MFHMQGNAGKLRKEVHRPTHLRNDSGGDVVEEGYKDTLNPQQPLNLTGGHPCYTVMQPPLRLPHEGQFPNTD